MPGHALHDGLQQRKLISHVLADPGQQGGHNARVELYHEELGNKTQAGAISPCARCGKVLFWISIIDSRSNYLSSAGT